MKARRVFSGNGIRIVVSVVLLMFFSLQLVKAQEWYNPAWPYRAPLTIENSLAGPLADFQVQVNLTTSGPWSSSASDGSDLRFTASDGVTELPYWIETWVYGDTACIWVKVPAIAASNGDPMNPEATVFMYYGASSMPVPEPVATPPAGPFTKHAGNPGVINGVGAPGATENILPENIVYDPVTQHYWMVLSDQTGGPYVGLVYSDDPANPDAWYWSGYPITGNPLAIAPHLIEYNGTWYIFYGDRSVASPYPISVASSSSVSGPYTKVGEVLPAGATGTWEAARVDEPYVFQRSDGTWILIYMGDAGGNVEQVGYATASSITGPYTKYTGNPCIPFGAAGSFDAGTVADPWVYEFDGVYYIGYTVSPTTSSPWQTALATTTDWVTFTKHGIILPRGTEYNSFRGAVTRIGDQYVFPYTGGPDNGQYRLCIATQPVFIAPPSSGDGDATFDFFDDFDGTILDVSKWIRTNGSSSQYSFDGDIMTMTGVPGTYAKIDAIKEFDFGYIGETYGQHDNDIPFVANEIIEYGFIHNELTTVIYDLRITDNYPTLNRYQRYINGVTPANFGPTADNEWHLFGLYRRSPGTAGFRVDDSEVTYSSSISTALLHPFLMAFAGTSTSGLPGQNFNVDWTRVRKYAEVDPVVTVGTVEDNINQWIGETSIYWNEPANWSKGVPDSSMNVFIASGTTYQPFIETESACRTIVINPGTTLTIGGTTTLNVAGDWINNGTFSTSAAATVNFNGETQAIGGTGYNAFQNVIVNSTVSATLNANAELYGDLSILSGVFDIGEYTINNTQPAGVLSVADNATLKIGDVNTLPGGYDTHILAPGSFTVYYGLDQQVAATTYGNLILSGNGTKTILSSITVTGNIKITESAMALLADGTVSTAGSLILGTEGQAEGTWGSSSVSPAPDHTNDTYFTSTGILDVNASITAGYWLGVTNNDWNTGSNWQGGAIPLPATDVVIPVYAVHAPVITGMSLPAVCNNLTVNQGAMLTIEPGQALTVNGNLINDGSISIESSWVNSNGSLIVDGSPSGSGMVSYKRFLREGDDTGDKHLLASPVDGQDVTDFIAAFGTKIDSVRIWNEYAGAWQRIESGMFTSGQGYNIYQADNSDGEFEFSGSLVNSATFTATSPYEDPYSSRGTDPYGNTDPTLINWTDGRGYISGVWTNWGGGGWNLLGNPFTSAMDAAAFISTNAGDFDPYYEALYVYDGPNGYYRYVASTVPGFEPDYVQGGSFGSRIQAGQGFMVMANNNNVVFNFTPAMQVHQTALPLLKSASVEEPWPGLKLKVKWGEKENLTTIVFNDVMKNSLDPGYDVGLLSTGPEVEIYTTLVEKDEAINLTRQALPVAGADTLKIPVGIDCYAGAEVTFSAYIIPMGNRRFWLEDRTAGTFTDLSLKGYTVTLPENTFGTGRFYIIASTNTPTAIKPTIRDNGDLRIWVARNMIVLKGNASQDARCELFDVNGKRILERQLTDGELNTIDIPAGLHGIYLVRVIDRQVITTRKIVIL